MRDTEVRVKGAPLSSSRSQGNFGSLEKTNMDLCLTPRLAHQPRSTACLHVTVPEEPEAEPGVHTVAQLTGWFPASCPWCAESHSRQTVLTSPTGGSCQCLPNRLVLGSFSAEGGSQGVCSPMSGLQEQLQQPDDHCVDSRLQWHHSGVSLPLWPPAQTGAPGQAKVSEMQEGKQARPQAPGAVLSGEADFQSLFWMVTQWLMS